MKASPVSPPQASDRSVHIAIANLNEVERALLATLICVLTDEALNDTRHRLNAGEIALCVEGGEVTFMDTDQLADDLAMSIAAQALPLPRRRS